MHECPYCGSHAEPDPEHPRIVRCLTCWTAWALPQQHRCSGTRNLLAPGLRVLDEYRDLNR